jgi:hypothetical protein
MVACADLEGAEVPADLATQPALAAFMADPLAGPSAAHRWLVDAQGWLWLTVAAWLAFSAWLRRAQSRRRR